MFNKKSNKALWVVFAALLILVIIVFSTDSTKKERSFKKNIVTVDTSSVSSFVIYPKSKPGVELKFLKNNDTWTISSGTGKQYTVPKIKIKSLFDQIIRIKPKRVAANSKSKWTEYQVDSSSTRIVVFEKGSEVLDLIIGKFSFQQPRSMSTFVRLADENEVYEVDGFLDMTFNKDINSFRNETVIKSDKNKWSKLSFSNSPNEEFTLIKIDSKWMIDGVETDSAKTEKALSSLARLSSTNYIDVDSTALPIQTSKLTIELDGGKNIVIAGYKDDSRFVIHSSQNQESYFDGNKIGEKIFIKKESFF